jgi:type II secretory pathway component PulJ
MKSRNPSAGVTLIELLIAVLLLSLLSVGIVLTLRVALSAMNKSGSKLMANRRVSSVERILDQQIEGIMPVTADCQAQPGVPGVTLMFFQGEQQSMRLASSYSLQQGERGVPMILEFQVIPGEDEQGVRLVVNEHWYTGPRLLSRQGRRGARRWSSRTRFCTHRHRTGFLRPRRQARLLPL